MTNQPTLKTKRLELVPFTDAHLSERYVGWLNDPDVVRYSEQRHLSHTLETCLAFTQGFKDGPSHLWAIVETAEGLGHIGNINTAVDPPNRVADVAILIGEKAAWGKGLGAEAWNAVVDYLLGDGGMRKVTAGCMAENKAMAAIMEKSGMVLEGVRQKHFVLDGKPVACILAARIKEDVG